MIRVLRPYQWIKNLLLFSPLFFSGHIVDGAYFITFVGVIVFSLGSGLGYVLNDWLDKDKDRFHPEKKNRPFCSREVSGSQVFLFSSIVAVIIALVLLKSSLSFGFVVYFSAYSILTVCYSFFLKHIVILEIFTVAFGFVLRVLAGGAVSQVEVSNWLFLTVFFIALMISIAKRITELKSLGKNIAVKHRKSQKGYSETFLNSLLWASGSITLVVYALYAVEKGSLVVFSVLPASYGIFRFIYLTDQGQGSDPIKTLFMDRQLLLTTLIFILFLALVIYGGFKF